MRFTGLDTLSGPSGPTGRHLTAQGHPRAIFKRAIEHGNVVAVLRSLRVLRDEGLLEFRLVKIIEQIG